jgi:aminopeptidase YwaD
MALFKMLLPASAFVISFSVFSGASVFNDGPGSNEITKSEILEHITYLASDELQGRFPGTEGDLLTQKYISEEFSKYKLKPAGDNGYVQPFEMYTHVQLSGNNTLSINVNGAESKYDVEKDFMPYGFSGSGSVSGEIMFVGYGISTP